MSLDRQSDPACRSFFLKLQGSSKEKPMMIRRTWLLGLALCLASGIHAAKAPNITTSNTINLPMFFQAPEIQDLTTTDITIRKTTYEDFTPIYTTLILDLNQDYRGKLIGKASFKSEE